MKHNLFRVLDNDSEEEAPPTLEELESMLHGLQCIINIERTESKVLALVYTSHREYEGEKPILESIMKCFSDEIQFSFTCGWPSVNS